MSDASPADQTEPSGSGLEQVGLNLRTLLGVRTPRPEQDPRGVAAICHAVLAVDTLGQLDRLADGVLDSLAQALDQLQDPRTGLYSTSSNRQILDLPDAMRTTQLALRTLNCLGRSPLYPLSCARQWTIDGPAEAWLAGETQANVTSIDLLVGLLYVLVYFAEQYGDDIARSRLHGLLDGLDRVQHPETGLWGTSRMRLVDRVIATAKIAAFFHYVHRPIQRIGRIADSVITSWPERTGRVGLSTEYQLCAIDLLLARLRAESNDPVRTRLLEWRTGTVSAAEGIGFGDDDDDALAASYRCIAAIHAIDRVLGDPVGEPLRALPQRDPTPGYAQPLPGLEGRDEVLARFWIRPLGRLDERLARSTQTASSTVVIPCHNLGIYLHDALASVAGQSLSDIDIVVVDDGSTDDYTRFVLDRWEARGLRIVRQPNRGVAEARNRGVRETDAPYVCCLDPDDRIAPDYLERAEQILDTDPEIGFVSGHTRMFDETDHVLDADACSLPDMYVRNLAVQPAVFRRSAWEAVGGYWGGFSSSGIEDWDLWIRILQSGLQAEVIPAVVWEYRIRPGQMSGTMFHPERWKTLTHELAVRHAAGYAAHAPMIFAGQQMEWAKLRAWANSLRTGVDFWRGQATGWQALATEHESMIEELRRWIDELETAKAWWQMQSEEWRRIAQSRNA